jgi:hypothetical protein
MKPVAEQLRRRVARRFEATLNYARARDDEEVLRNDGSVHARLDNKSKLSREGEGACEPG